MGLYMTARNGPSGLNGRIQQVFVTGRMNYYGFI